MLTGRKLLIGVTGGIAAFKTAALVSQLVQRGATVDVVLTAAAERFVGAATFEALTARRVHRSLFDDGLYPLGPHIGLTEGASLLCVAPATANFLAKAACGLADDLLSTLYLAYEGPVLMAPAMNSAMWAKPAVQRNVEQLLADGVRMVGPDDGWLSCRQHGAGRMASPEQMLDEVERLLQTPAG